MPDKRSGLLWSVKRKEKRQRGWGRGVVGVVERSCHLLRTTGGQYMPDGIQGCCDRRTFCITEQAKG